MVLDASALIAGLFREPGGERVGDQIEKGGAVISTVNLSEVLERIRRTGGDAHAVLDMLLASKLTIEPFSVHHAELAASLAAVTKSAGLSLGDRACLALALELGAPALTADRVWLTVPHGVQVEVIR